VLGHARRLLGRHRRGSDGGHRPAKQQHNYEFTKLGQHHARGLGRDRHHHRIATIRTDLPFLLNLNAEQRKKLQNITEASQGITQATINFVTQHPEALPSTFNVAEFNKDAALLTPFQQVASLIANLNTDTDDTLRALHSDLYGETLDVYAYAKAANRAGAYDDYINIVKTRFATGPRKASSAAKKTTP
jgi:hypothetical protein